MRHTDPALTRLESINFRLRASKSEMRSCGGKQPVTLPSWVGAGVGREELWFVPEAQGVLSHVLCPDSPAALMQVTGHGHGVLCQERRDLAVSP